MVKAVVPKGKSRGTYIGRLARVRASGAFSIRTKSGRVGKSHRYCQVIQHADGYDYTIGDAVSLYRRPRLGIPPLFQRWKTQIKGEGNADNNRVNCYQTVIKG
ncbi:uncharacterized protein METZ01_LOCUS189021 [marine metagenome]|uniref:Uncharacterized protein n=1 Tax=marine metagenome TaxID=408172 RepID=A0A382DEU8_9ZZZZ